MVSNSVVQLIGYYLREVEACLNMKFNDVTRRLNSQK